MASPHATGLAALYIAANGRAGDAAGVIAIRKALIEAGKTQESGYRLAHPSTERDDYPEPLGWAGSTVVGNLPPVADAGGDQVVTADESGNALVTLDGSASSDPDGYISSYVWTVYDKDELPVWTENVDVTSCTLSISGSPYTAMLIVTDNGGADELTDDDWVTITVLNNQSPFAEAGPDQTVTADDYGNALVTLDGSESSDPDGYISSYVWTVYDKDQSQVWTDSVDLTICPLSISGSPYTAILTVADNGGLIDTDTATVTITEAIDLTMVVADIDMSYKVAGPNRSATATVWVEDSLTAPVAGAVVSGHWEGKTSDSDTGITDAAGKVVLTSDKVKSSGTFTFIIDNLSKDGWSYDRDKSVTSAEIDVP